MRIMLVQVIAHVLESRSNLGVFHYIGVDMFHSPVVHCAHPSVHNFILSLRAKWKIDAICVDEAILDEQIISYIYSSPVSRRAIPSDILDSAGRQRRGAGTS